MHFRIENLPIFQSTKCQQAQEIMIFLDRVKLKISGSRIMSQEKYRNKIAKKE